MTRDRPASTSTGEIPDEVRVCAVATHPDTFDLCREGVYPSPRSYERTREPFEAMAFYRTAPVSAITHYAAVHSRVEQRRGDPGPLSAADWAATIDPFADTEAVVVFELGPLTRLATPVANDQTGLRGARYCTLAALQGAATLSEL